MELSDVLVAREGTAYGYCYRIGEDYSWEVAAYCGALVDYGEALSEKGALSEARKAARKECEG